MCNANQCLVCKIGYFLYNDTNGVQKCKRHCPDGYGSSRDEWLTITNMSTGVVSTGTTLTVQRDVCIVCPQNCRTCNYQICLYCKPSYKYHEGACVDVCPDGFYSSFGICNPCSKYGNCVKCNSGGCTTCYPGLSKVQGMCQSSCVYDPTATVTTTTTDPVTNTTTSTTSSAPNLCNFNCSSPCQSCYGPASD